jgi:UDP-4-amino-4,6-dideoxy-N-acetyl-beta-L-altrosamine transaminase
MIPYGKQNIDQSDVQEVLKVLQSDFITQGPAVNNFENAITSYTGAQHAVAVTSATSALHLACLALGVTTGDLVWTTPISFVASANCALYCGANIDFVDIDSKTFNLCPKQLAQKLRHAKDKIPKVLIVVHMAGQPCDMEAIYQLSQKYNFKIIEDAAHAIGATYAGKKVGNSPYSDITTFSFHPVKIITTGEGGAAVTNSVELANKLKLLRSHGITRDINLMTKNDGPWYYEQLNLGYNYRMTDIQAALGASQINRIDKFIEKRHQIAKFYDEAFANNDFIKTPYQNSIATSAYHLYIIQLQDNIAHKHQEIFISLREAGLGVNLHYIPIYLQPYYRSLGFNAGYMPEAEDYYKRSISIPIFYDMTEKMCLKVAKTITEVINNYA